MSTLGHAGGEAEPSHARLGSFYSVRTGRWAHAPRLAATHTLARADT